jgi:hypothetical protein
LQEQYLFIHEVLQVLIKRKQMREMIKTPSTPNHYIVGPFSNSQECFDGRRASVPHLYLPRRSHVEAFVNSAFVPERPLRNAVSLHSMLGHEEVSIMILQTAFIN